MVNWKSKYLEMKLKYVNAKHQKGGMNGISQEVIERAFMNDRYNDYEKIKTRSDHVLALSGLTYEDRMIALEMSKYYKYNQELIETTLEPHITKLMDLQESLPNDHVFQQQSRLLRSTDYHKGIVLEILQEYKRAIQTLKKLEKDPIYMRHPHIIKNHIWYTFLKNDFFQLKNPATGDPKIVLSSMQLPSGMNFEGVNLSGVDFSGSVLTRTNFKGANLSGALLSMTEIKFSDFTGANLDDTDWKQANLVMIKIYNASTEGSNIDDAIRRVGHNVAIAPG